MIISLNGHRAKLLGDPHLGRRFVHGVPLHRRGEREALVWADFAESLVLEDGVAVHVCMGDIFDRAIVPYGVILRVAGLYRQARRRHPQARFFILRGNHDGSRDLERASAFDMLAELLAGDPAIHVVRSRLVVPDLAAVFVPWDPVATAEELLGGRLDGVSTAFGHWDTESFGGDDHNLIPTKALSKAGIATAYTGHVHLAGEFARDGVRVVVTGSMQPYAFGEETDDSLYQTVRLAELEGRDVKNKVVRVLLEPGETFDREIDCLQIVVKRLTDQDDDQADLNVSLGAFDMDALFAQAFAEVGAPEDKLELVKARYNETRLAE